MTPAGRRVVVTGAGGFIGAAITRRLAQTGHVVTALVRPGSSRQRLEGLSVTCAPADVTDPASLRGLFRGADWVVHAAGKLGAAGVPELLYQTLHVDGTRHVLRLVQAEAPGARVLHVSSLGVVGPVRHPQRTGWPDERALLAPTNPYERSKATAERVVRNFTQAGLDVVLVRPEFVYGPGDRHVLGLFQAIQRGFFFYIGSGLNWCHPTYIEDVVDGMMAALERGGTGQVYHLTGPRPVTWRALAGTAADILGVPPPRWRAPRWLVAAGAWGAEVVAAWLGRTPPLSRTGVAFFSENRGGNWAKAQREIGYTPATSLPAGLARTILWYRQHGLL